MNFLKLSEILHSEEKSEDFLKQKGILKTFKCCPFCGCDKFYPIRRKKIKCKKCRKEWSAKKDSLLEGLKISSQQFLSILKLFELEISGLKCSKEMKINPKTVARIYKMLRQSLIEPDFLLSGEVEMDESYFGGRRKGNRGRGAAGKVPVFGILERDGKVSLEIVKDVSSETLHELALQKVKRGSLIYTDRFRSYNGLVSYGFKHKRINHAKRFANGKVYINGIEGFWSYAKERLIKFHGVGKENFIYYIKEMEFRYNNRNEELFERIIEIFANYSLVVFNT